MRNRLRGLGGSALGINPMRHKSRGKKYRQSANMRICDTNREYALEKDKQPIPIEKEDRAGLLWGQEVQCDPDRGKNKQPIPIEEKKTTFPPPTPGNYHNFVTRKLGADGDCRQLRLTREP